jgi:SNF2 family DNA or RNA helicase
MVLGDATGTGKTIQQIGAYCYLWEKNPAYKVIVVCPKSAIRQWASEVDKFTTGVRTFLATGSFPERKKAYEAWVACEGPAIVVTNYHGLVRDWDQGAKEGKPGFLDALTKPLTFGVTFDEAVAFKNPSTKTHQTCRLVADRATRVYGLTATLLKNNLQEGFGIYRVIKPDVFSSKTKFLEQYCVTEMQRVHGGGKVPIVVGYKNLAHFRDTIAPYFYGRAKHEISDELPTLTTREIVCELSPAEDRKYAEALTGVLELGDGDVRDFQDTKALTSLIYCQQVVDSLALLKYEDGGGPDEGSLGAKEQALLDLLSEEFDDEKVIVYTRFESLVGRLQKVLAKAKIKSVRITGKENANQRKASQDKFQDVKSDVPVVFITDAGSEAINLQAACAIVFYDSPWSWGNYVQLLGRPIRIGSIHPTVYAIHLVAQRPGKKPETIDHATIRALRKKKSMIDQVIGEAAAGALTFDRGEGGLRDLYEDLRSSAK